MSAKRGRYTKALQLKFPEWRIDPVLASINVPVAYDEAHPVFGVSVQYMAAHF